MSGSKGNLAYGLNSRNKSKRKKGPIDILGGGDDGSDDSDVDGDGAPAGGGGGGGGRGAVNREIAAEQAALRKRAEAAMAAKGADATTAAYDYDAEYDSFSGGKEEEKRTKDDDDDADAAAAKEKGVRAKPRYIAGLLRTAERRNKVYEVVHEKMVIREQVADVNPEYEGKETFVTSSYKRKMEEREKWAREEEERTRREEEEDAKLRERRGGLAVGGLMLGVVGRNLLVEGGGDRGGGGDGDRDGVGVGGEDGKIADRQEVSELDGRDRHGANEGESDGEARGDARVIDAAADRDGDYRDRWREQSEPRRRPSAASFVAKNGGENATPAAAAAATTIADGTMRTTRKEDEGAGKTAETKKCRRRVLEERATKIRDARKRYFERLGGGRGATATRTSRMKKVDAYD